MKEIATRCEGYLVPVPNAYGLLLCLYVCIQSVPIPLASRRCDTMK